MAELKASNDPSRRDSIIVTHGVTAVAELKDGGPAAPRRGPPAVTHGVTAVAELKGSTSPRRKDQSWRSHPRRHRRGRIEGLPSYTPRASLHRVTHGVTAVAELKDGIW